MHKVFCFMGRTAAGKSTVAKEIAKRHDLKILKSYTTRDMRPGETEKNSDHIFITEDEVEQYRDKMVAHTERVGYQSFATSDQLLENDIYIINPSGVIDLMNSIKMMDLKVDLVIILISSPYLTLAERAKQRGDYDTWLANYTAENDEFREFYSYSSIPFMHVLNDGDIEETVSKVEKIMERYKDEQTKTIS